MPVTHTQLFLFLYYFLIAVFLSPPVYVIIGYSHGIGKYTTIFLFLWFIAKAAYEGYQFKIRTFGTVVLILYVTSLALSAISILDAGAYLHRFKDIIIALMMYFMGIYVVDQNHRRHQKVFFTIILASIFINLSMKLFLYLYPDSLHTFFAALFYPDYIDTIAVNLQRDRIYFESFDEIFLPLMFVALNAKEARKKALGLVFSLLITLMSFLSNFRTKFLMLIASFVWGIFLFSRKRLGSTLLASGVLLMTVIIAMQVVGSLRGFTVIDRFLLTDEMGDVVTITRRGELFETGIAIGMSSPIYGIGLNQFDYHVEAAAFPTDPTRGATRDLLSDDRRPHDLFSFTFAETGMVGLTALFLLYLYFIVQDQKTLNNGKAFDKALVGAFWSLQVFALLNPAANFSYTILFWILRSHLESMSKS